MFNRAVWGPFSTPAMSRSKDRTKDIGRNKETKKPKGTTTKNIQTERTEEPQGMCRALAAFDSCGYCLARLVLKVHK